MKPVREVVGRRSLFHGQLVPVINPAAVLRLARRKFGKPATGRGPFGRTYQWSVAPFDLLTIVVRVPPCVS